MNRLVEMFRIIKSKAILLITILFLCGCAKNQDRPHPEGISAAKLNQAIQVIAPQAWNTFKLNEPVSLQIINISNQPLIFDKNFGTRIFIIEDDRWKEVENRLISIGSDGILMKPTANGENDTRGFSIKLDLSEKKSKTELRVYILGKDSDTEEVVGGFIDLVLKP
jgi:hypothetical protein